MKRFINLCFIFCTLMFAIGCTMTHTHKYTDGVCSCGEVDPDYEEHVHEFVEGICECGETDPNYKEPEHTHDYVDGVCSCGDKEKYTVVFKDMDGTVLKTEEVTRHGEVTEPTMKDIYGYKFVGWDKDFSNIESDLEINAVYEEMEFTVKFYGLYGELLKEETVLMKHPATAPAAPEVPYHVFSGWDVDFESVEFNMTIRAVYDTLMEDYPMDNVNYWLQELSKKHNIFETVMTEEEIKVFNDLVYSDYSATEVVDVQKLAHSVPKNTVLNMINGYTNINKYTVYNDETRKSLTTNEKNEILANRNLDNISDMVDVKFGLVVDFGWLRSYPTNHYSNNYSMDRFQETSLNVGEPVAIYHESSDGNWYFVQAENYNGWIEKQYIGVCSYDEMAGFLNANDRLVVISDYVEINSAYVRMGQSFPITSLETESYQILFPTRNVDGTLELITKYIEPSNDYSVGYLEYTLENMIKQAFKLLGIDYSWGDKEKAGRDCSSTMNAIYRSFGFVMPRNTSNQLAIPTHGLKVGGLTTTTMKKYQPGTMIFTSSHVMLYIGEDTNGNPYLLHNTTSGNGGCILQSLQSYGGSKMIAVLRPYNVN